MYKVSVKYTYNYGNGDSPKKKYMCITETKLQLHVITHTIRRTTNLTATTTVECILISQIDI